MRPTQPVPDSFISCVTAKTNAIGCLDREIRKGDDLADVALSIHVKTPIAVTILALHALQFVESMLEVLGELRVTRDACVRPNLRSTGHFHELRKSVRAFPPGSIGMIRFCLVWGIQKKQ